jgi:hypothetical protein
MLFMHKKTNILRGRHGFLFILLLLCSRSYAENDKAIHYGVSAAAGYVAETLLHKKLNSDTKRIIYGTVPGVIKEIIDANDKSDNGSGIFNKDDLLADIAGAFTVSILAAKPHTLLLYVCFYHSCFLETKTIPASFLTTSCCINEGNQETKGFLLPSLF